jgi:hypothetical protein
VLVVESWDGRSTEKELWGEQQKCAGGGDATFAGNRLQDRERFASCGRTDVLVVAWPAKKPKKLMVAACLLWPQENGAPCSPRKSFWRERGDVAQQRYRVPWCNSEYVFQMNGTYKAGNLSRAPAVALDAFVASSNCAIGTSSHVQGCLIPEGSKMLRPRVPDPKS